MSLHRRSIVTAGVHFLVSLAVFFLLFAAAWGSGLSDADHGDGGAGGFVIVLALLQAPVALIQWLAVRFSADGRTGLPPQALILLAIPSSVAYGYAISFFLGASKTGEQNRS